MLSQNRKKGFRVREGDRWLDLRIMPITTADTVGNSSGRPNSRAAIRRMTKMPTVATCDTPRQTMEGCPTGSGSLIAS
jgi:hypothetical protein